jgi:dihydroxyacetone kinase DhaKLM complex PTS-EIIA-like component DhaM
MEENIIKLTKLVENLERDVYSVKRLLSEIEKAGKTNYKELPGVVGIFDGFYLTPENGEKIEVPQNYSAKSRLVYGDTLKVIDEEGKKLFKQIAKVSRKRVEGVVNKKEGKWYVLADIGSYRLNDAAVEFHNLNINDKITVSIPEDNIGAPFATLEKAPENAVRIEEVKKFEPKARAEVKRPLKAAVPHTPSIHKEEPFVSKEAKKAVSPKTVEPKEEKPKVDREFVGNLILSDDDLR